MSQQIHSIDTHKVNALTTLAINTLVFGVLLTPTPIFAKSYGAFGDSSSLPTLCGPNRDNVLMMGAMSGNGQMTSQNAYLRYIETLLNGWYMDKVSKGYSSRDLSLAREMVTDSINYVKANCP